MMTTLVAWLGLLLALSAAGFIWKLNQELETARRRLDRYNKALFDAGDEIRQLRETLAETTATLRVELMHRTGTPAFTPEMTVRAAQLLHPQAGEVLASFHLGGCSSCAVEPDATLAEVCAQQGLPGAQLLGTLNLLLGTAQGAVANGTDANDTDANDTDANDTDANGAHTNGGGEANGARGLQPFVPQPVKLPNVEFDI